MQLCSKSAFHFKEQLRSIHSVQGICLGGLFVSLYVVLSLFNIRFSEILEFRLAFLSLAAAAFYGGPLMGMTVGIAGDVISFFVTPQSAPFFPGFTLTYALMGFLFGIFLYRTKITPGRALLGGLTEFSLSCTLSTFWLHLMYGMDWQYLLTIRLIKNTIALGVYTILIYVFLNAFSRVLGASKAFAKPAH
ncbi:MAG: folate family ECF transporter S component [Lachnospiraceae bacterium]|jgi:ECF transporter S component (folate family)|nr:folate family ECF transporter S component [Lachnospiraceae bacterium]